MRFILGLLLCLTVLCVTNVSAHERGSPVNHEQVLQAIMKASIIDQINDCSHYIIHHFQVNAPAGHILLAEVVPRMTITNFSKVTIMFSVTHAAGKLRPPANMNLSHFSFYKLE